MPADYDGVWANGSDAWVSGQNPAGGIVAHNAGGTWLTATAATPFGGVWSDGSAGALISALDDQDFVASDNGTAISLPQVRYGAGTTAAAKKVWGESLSSAWFVSRSGDILYYNGSLALDTQATASTAFNAVNGFVTASGSELWAVGEFQMSNLPVLYHAKGPPGARNAADNWTQETNLPVLAPGTVFNDVVAVGPRDIYIVGSEDAAGIILHGHTP